MSESCFQRLFYNSANKRRARKEQQEEKKRMTFIHLEETYDSVSRNRMWRSLQEYNIDNRLIGVIKELCADNKAYIKQENRLS